jgi:TolB-like protein
VLRSDPETDFLAFSLPDAIATSLSGFGSLIVRSTAAAARFGEAPDLRALATEADVDRVVMGTLLRVGDQLRATAQLVEAPAGTLITSHSIQAPLGDLFHLQDDIAHRVVESLSLPLGGVPPSSPDTPRDAKAYGIYLRANQLALSYDQLPQARDLYESCLKLDPEFAPAWARLGRCLRVIGKYIDASLETEARGEQALRRALELNPRLSIAHKFYASLEADSGQVQQALMRLLGEAGRHGNDPELFAGLVHTCRYGGLFEQSIAAHDEARRLDPNVTTSIEQTRLMAGDVAGVLAADRPLAIGSGDDVIRVVGLGLTGRRAEAQKRLTALRATTRILAFQVWADFLGAWLDRQPDLMRVRRGALDKVHIMKDPEATFQEGWLFCDAGDHAYGLMLLRRAVTRGYYVASTLVASPQFDPLRGEPAFQEMLHEAEAGRALLLEAFRDAGGESLLGRRSS